MGIIPPGTCEKKVSGAGFRRKKVVSEDRRAISVQWKAVGAERENATPIETEGCASSSVVAGVGFEPEVEQKQEFTQSNQNSTKPLQTMH